jgi:hypothetical protein
MLRHPVYLTFGLLVLALATLAEYRGWSFTSYSEAQTVPKSVRDNPGAYRPVYRGYGRYFGGK